MSDAYIRFCRAAAASAAGSAIQVADALSIERVVATKITVDVTPRQADITFPFSGVLPTDCIVEIGIVGTDAVAASFGLDPNADTDDDYVIAYPGPNRFRLPSSGAGFKVSVVAL